MILFSVHCWLFLKQLRHNSCWHRLDLTLYSFHGLTIKTEQKEKMKRLSKLCGGALRALVHHHR